MIGLMELAIQVDQKNAKYIVNDPDIVAEYEAARVYSQTGPDGLVDFCLERCRKMAEEFDANYLTPANVKVGDGATICLYSDRHACTIIRVTAKTVTVKRDKAKLDSQFMPKFIWGGFGGYCTNAEEQSYSYEEDPEGEEKTFWWSEKFISYGQPDNIHLCKGRHEYYDYNF